MEEPSRVPTRRLRWMDAVWPAAILVAAGIVVGVPVHAPSAPSAIPPTVLSVPSSTPAVFVSSTVPVVDASQSASTTVVHVPMPSEVRGIYWTAWTAGSQHGQDLLSYMTKTGLNAVVIDLKVDDGELAFEPHDASLTPYVQKSKAMPKLDVLLAQLAQKHIYRIARIFVMRDGAFGTIHPEDALHTKTGGIWKDNTGTPWLDPAAPAVAQYALALGKEAYARGFDEVQYDYVRFPSDGPLTGIVYPVYDGKESKVTVMQDFFNTVGGGLQKEHIPVSFDLFGMTFWKTDDFGIGQRLQDVLPVANAVSPMAYPSHYPNGFQGFANPADHPYDIVNQTLNEGAKLIESESSSTSDKTLRSTFRPWIQDFNIGAFYTAPLVEAEIKAARDAGASGFLIWNARNVYTTADYLKK
ncbi:MAG: putative glycoside hydrolase [Patescibacteria group bacterium]